MPHPSALLPHAERDSDQRRPLDAGGRQIEVLERPADLLGVHEFQSPEPDELADVVADQRQRFPSRSANSLGLSFSVDSR
jgi:hypothetical protein